MNPIATFSEAGVRVNFTSARSFGKERFWLEKALSHLRAGRSVAIVYVSDEGLLRLHRQLRDLLTTPEEIAKFKFIQL